MIIEEYTLASAGRLLTRGLQAGMFSSARSAASSASAAVIEPITQGIRSLTFAGENWRVERSDDRTDVRLIGTEGAVFPQPSGFARGKRAVVFNLAISCKRCPRLPFGEFFGSGELFGLKAVVLTFNTASGIAEVGIVLPVDGLKPYPHREDGFTVVCIDRTGGTKVSVFLPLTEQKDLLHQALGMGDTPLESFACDTSTTLQDAVRAIGGVERFFGLLPGLKDYLIGLGEQQEFHHNQHRRR